MAELDDLYVKLQVYLIKKNDECGPLRFITSRTTDANFANVLELCDTVQEIMISCGIPTEEKASAMDPKCVQSFKYLLLNTEFESQEMLAEDTVNGYLVDMCPSLSPYLLIEIVWLLGYEEILARSILHVPLDLAVEVIDIVKRCLLLLDFSRSLKFLYFLTLTCYKTLRYIAEHGAITRKLSESLERLMIYCQDFMSLFVNDTFTRINEVSGIKKSERHGLVIKTMMKLTKDCLDCAKNGVSFSSEESALYKLTFGREPPMFPNESFAVQLNMLDQEFVYNLLKKGADLDVRTYLDWASLEDPDNFRASFQKALGAECHDFIEFIKDYKNLIKLDNLIECLQQISSKPGSSDSSDDGNIEEMQRDLLNGEIQCLKLIMKHHHQWNEQVFYTIRKYYASMDKEDFFYLLEYLSHVMTKHGQEERKRDVYTLVTKVLLKLDIKAVYETIVDYILMQDARNTLESANTEQVFKNFMAHNKNFRSSTNLRMVLFFLAKNPEKFIAILIKMVIGNPEYCNVMVTPNDFVLLSPILSIRKSCRDTLVVEALQKVCIENDEWNTKKFLHFVKVILDECVVSIDDLVNIVFVPYFYDSSNRPENIICILNCLRINMSKCTTHTNFEVLFFTIATKGASVRRDVRLRKSSISQVLALLTRVINLFAETRLKDMSENSLWEIVKRLDKLLKPIDKHHVVKFLFQDPSERSKNTFESIIRDYEQRCVVAVLKVSQHQAAKSEPPLEIASIPKLDFSSIELQDHFIRHFILTSIESEYVQMACESTILQSEFLRCENEYLAYEKFVRLTIDACIFTLEFPQANSPDALTCLLKKLIRFTSKFLNLQNVCLQKIDHALLENIRELDRSIAQTTLYSLWTNLIVEINNRDPRGPSTENLQFLLDKMHNFVYKCQEIAHFEKEFKGPPSVEAKNFKVGYDFVEEVTSPDFADENYSALSKMYTLLCTPETNE